MNFFLICDFYIFKQLPLINKCSLHSPFLHQCLMLVSHVWLFVTPWTVTHQTPPPVGKNTGEGSHFSSRGSSRPRVELESPALAGRFSTIWTTREALLHQYVHVIHGEWELNIRIDGRKESYISWWISFINATLWLAFSEKRCLSLKDSGYNCQQRMDTNLAQRHLKGN